MMLFSASCTTTTGPIPVEDRSRSATVYDIEADDTVSGKVDNSINAPDNTSQVVASLMTSAEKSANAGANESAQATLERALRLEPKNPLLWNRMAALHLQEGKLQQALTLARRSNSLAGGNYSLQIENWNIILRAKIKADDKQGAIQAREEIERLQKLNIKN